MEANDGDDVDVLRLVAEVAFAWVPVLWQAEVWMCSMMTIGSSYPRLCRVALPTEKGTFVVVVLIS